MSEAAQHNLHGAYAWGPLSALGLALAVLTGVADQALKFWLFYGYDLGAHAPVAIAPFVDLVLTWNSGISYGLFPQHSAAGQWLLLAIKLVAVLALWIWLARTSSRVTAAGLGLIVGGALGNVVDVLHWPGVMDFVFFHIETASWTFRWYQFNLADVAIVAGVIGLLYDSLQIRVPQKRPDRG